MDGDSNLNKSTTSTANYSQNSPDYRIKESANIDAGFVWERLSIGYRIEELKINRFNEALDMAKDVFFTSEPMCKATLLAKDKKSAFTYLELINTWMKEMRSMCAVDEKTGKLVGILVATVNRKADQANDWSRVRMSQGEAIFKIQTLKSCVFGAARLYEKYEITEYFRLQVLCVETSLQNRGIGTALVRSFVEYHRRLQLPACIGAFSSGAAQTIADRLGFINLAEIPYQEYASVEKTDRPFLDVGCGNYSIACMGLRTLVPAILQKAPSKSTSLTSSKTKKKKNNPK